ncbi:SCP2 domain-containing protein [Thalassospira profundimaris]|uniref:ubiquinone anaerobic biosynthesis accessory factor UbiT n=1 Tax=Thalassospira profundimaris TaxID=502049 RepID=UPI00215D7F8A|nr:SCP2 sterol-binding domain-containing protein [Thalassospira profundimaris]
MSVARPAFTPFLLLGPIVAAMPGWLIDRVLAHAIATMQSRHAAVFDRFGPAMQKGKDAGDVAGQPYDGRDAGTGIVVSPLDLGIDLYLRLDPVKSVLRRATVADRKAAQATIIGPLPALLQLLEGTSDGDALFFSRTLKIEGRTEIVVALRNALDGENIDIRQAVVESFGLLGPVARRALKVAERGYHRLDRDMARFTDAFAGASDKKQAGLADRVEDLSLRLASAESQIRRRQPARGRGPAVSVVAGPSVGTVGEAGTFRAADYANSTKDDFSLPETDTPQKSGGTL